MTLRQRLSLLHRWLGLSIGVLFAFLGITGSILVFDHALDANVINRDLWLVEERAAPFIGIGEAVDRLGAQRPQGSDHAVQRQIVAGRALWGRYTRLGASGPENWIAVIDPYDGTIRGDYAYGQFPLTRRNALTILYELHRTLLAGRLGELIVGISGIFVLLSLVLGYSAWWPRGGKWQTALTMKRGASFRRQMYDVHKLSGVYAGGVLLATVFAGIYLALPSEFTAIVKAVAPVSSYKVFLSTPVAAQKRSASNAEAGVDRKTL